MDGRFWITIFGHEIKQSQGCWVVLRLTQAYSNSDGTGLLRTNAPFFSWNFPLWQHSSSLRCEDFVLNQSELRCEQLRFGLYAYHDGGRSAISIIYPRITLSVGLRSRLGTCQFICSLVTSLDGPRPTHHLNLKASGNGFIFADPLPQLG